MFSITIVVLQLSSGQFSPRVLRTFLRDRIIQIALGVFIATFVYAMVVLRSVQSDAAPAGFVPRVGVTGAFALVLASVALFIVYINHVANLVRVATIIALIGAERPAPCWSIAAQPTTPANRRSNRYRRGLLSPRRPATAWWHRWMRAVWSASRWKPTWWCG